jgi:BirA family biotin operon repressor/biotin-[acetyl-CoA-carboxylase] ligase
MQVFAYNEIDSTNSEAKRLIETNQISGTAIVKTKIQTAGRGRLERIWQTMEGNLAFSVVIPKKWVKNANILPAMVCVAVRNCITENDCVKFKWPNDLLACKDIPAKFSGILIENVGEFLIVGIGVNVGWSPENVMYEATHLEKHGMKIEGEEKVAKELLQILNSNEKDVLKKWAECNFYNEKQVQINGQVGIFVGVSENFEAKILVDEQIHLISYGDVC